MCVATERPGDLISISGRRLGASRYEQIDLMESTARERRSASTNSLLLIATLKSCI
jgi:hypothetical protein